MKQLDWGNDKVHNYISLYNSSGTNILLYKYTLYPALDSDKGDSGPPSFMISTSSKKVFDLFKNVQIVYYQVRYNFILCSFRPHITRPNVVQSIECDSLGPSGSGCSYFINKQWLLLLFKSHRHKNSYHIFWILVGLLPLPKATCCTCSLCT